MKKIIVWLIIDLLLIFITSIPEAIASETVIIKCYEIEQGILIGILSTVITRWILDD